MKNILFIAPPAGGKGTQSGLLVENFGYIHISTGDLLRDIDESSPLGKKIREIQVSGKLVDDETVFELLEEKLQSIKGKPFLLDGCARTVRQAELLEQVLYKLDMHLDLVIELDVPYDILLKRATGRISCPKCKAIFNKYFKPPHEEGVCDHCHEALVSRNDDNEETFKTRYETYLENATPLIEYYKNLGKLVKIDGINNTYEMISEKIKND